MIQINLKCMKIKKLLCNYKRLNHQIPTNFLSYPITEIIENLSLLAYVYKL